jgi:hypothetical protein
VSADAVHAADSPHAPIPVTVRGLWRGRELYGEGTLTVLEEGVLLCRPDTMLRMRHTDLEGVAHRPGELALFLAGGDVLEMFGGARLAAVERVLVRRACFMPEFTRALRAVGTPETRLGAEHDRFFGPLLTARARAQKLDDFASRAAAFDAEALGAILEATVRAFAAERHPDSAPDRRALEAELFEIAEPLLASLPALRDAGARLAAADDATRFLAWRGWLDAVRRVFAEADRCWATVRPVLGERPPEPPSPRGWRRFFGRR